MIIVTLATMAVASPLGPAQLGPLEPWRPAFAFAREDGSLAPVEDLMRLGHAFHARRTLAPAVRRRVRRLGRRAETLDAAAIHAMLDPRDGWGALSLAGRLTAEGAYHIDDGPRPGSSRFGDGQLVLQMRPEAEDVYRARTELRVRLGQGSGQLYDFARITLDWLRSEASRRPPSRSRGWDASDARILGALRSAFPATSRLVLRYFEVRDVVSPGPRGRVHLRLRRRALRADFPQLARDEGPTAVAYTGRARIVGSAGQTLGLGWIDSKTMDLVAVFVPDARALSQPRYVTTARFDTRAGGVEVRVDGLRVRTTARTSTAGARFDSVMSETPRVRVRGAGLVDALIPGDVRGLVLAFFETLVSTRGEHGVGAWWSLGVPRDRAQSLRFETLVDVRVNGFVTMMLRLAQALNLGPEGLEVAETLLGRGMKALHEDFRALAAAVAAPAR